MIKCILCKKEFILSSNKPQKITINNFKCIACRNNQILRLIHYSDFNCVYRPPLECINEPNTKNYLYGICKYTDYMTADLELFFYNKLNKIDPEFKFHINPPICKKPKYIPKKCPINIPYKDRILLIYEYGGKTLSYFINNELYINKIVKGFVNIFYAIYILNKNKYIHDDIKNKNIICIEEMEQLNLKLIDFELSWDMNKDSPIKYDFQYEYWPWEKILLYNNISDYHVYNHIKKYIRRNLCSIPKTYSIYQLVQIYSELKNLNIKELQNLIKQQLDLFAFGISLYKLFKNYNDKYLKDFSKMLIHPDIRQRIIPKKALEFYIKYIDLKFPKNNITEFYKKKINDLN